MIQQQFERLAQLEPQHRTAVLTQIEAREKSTATFALLALFFGAFGIHHFYLGRTISGVFSILLCWTLVPALLALVELVFSPWIVGAYNRRIAEGALRGAGV